jgi:integrase
MACIAKRRGRYVIDFYDNTGSRHWFTLPKGATKEKAKEALREIERQVERGIYLPVARMPTFKEIGEAWLEHKRTNVRESTWIMYKGHINNHFQDILDIKISKITSPLVEKYISKKQAECIALASIRKLLVTFGQVMNYAVRHKYIDHNPVREAERPKGQGAIEKERSRILRPNEVTALLAATPNPKYKLLFMLAAMSGARQGELLGLKWADIDWDNKQLSILRTFNKGRWYQPKSHHSIRRIDLGPAMLSELRKWKMACPPNKQNLVFPTVNGETICHGNMLRRHFYPAVKEAGLKHLRFHDLRHTYASLLIDQGENIKYIQMQLGHSSPTITLNVYAHLLNKQNHESAIRLESAIFKI